MLRCSSFVQVQCNWYWWELLKVTIVKLGYWKLPQGLFFEKIAPQIPLQIYGENAKQVVFTPIKFVKQSYWSKGHHCTFIQRVARSEKQFSQRKQTLRSCWQVITYQVKPFLNNVSFCESFCSFKVGCFTAIKNASRFFFYGYSEVLTLKKWVKRDAWLVLNLYLDFHAYSNK